LRNSNVFADLSYPLNRQEVAAYTYSFGEHTLKTAIALVMFLCAAGSSTAQSTWQTVDYSRWFEYQDKLNQEETERSFLNHATISPGLSPESTISAARLRHRPPTKAIAAFERGIRFAKAGSRKKSAAEFQKAIELDPQFSEAYGDLGVQYLTLGLFDTATAELRRAIELDRATSTHHANLSLALILLNQLPEAELEAKTAITLDPANARAHYLLGCVLTNHPETWHSATEHFAYAAEKFPEAHAALADLYAAAGDQTSAAAESQRYRQAQIRQKHGGHQRKSPDS
jgi:tetratricopeptide (TPR) repeat protein